MATKWKPSTRPFVARNAHLFPEQSNLRRGQSCFGLRRLPDDFFRISLNALSREEYLGEAARPEELDSRPASASRRFTMLGRTLKVAVVIGLTQLASGCCCCWRPFFCHSCCGGCSTAPCASCYSPAIAPAPPVVAPFPVSVAPTPGAPIIPQATSSANNPTIDKTAPFSSANYTHPIR